MPLARAGIVGARAAGERQDVRPHRRRCTLPMKPPESSKSGKASCRWTRAGSSSGRCSARARSAAISSRIIWLPTIWRVGHDRLDKGERAEKVCDPGTRHLALSQGARRFPRLEFLRPQRTSTSRRCTECEDDGRIRIDGTLMPEGILCRCGGLGWSHDHAAQQAREPVGPSHNVACKMRKRRAGTARSLRAALECTRPSLESSDGRMLRRPSR